MIVINSWGTEIYYNVAEQHMDDDIREELHRKLEPCTEQEFFNAYCEAHLKRFGEDFFLDEKNPVY